MNCHRMAEPPAGAAPISDVFEVITGFANLRRAAARAARGKRRSSAIAQFLFRLEPELLSLQHRLREGVWRPGQPFDFEILEPKRRTIRAAPFADRVVHHAAIDPIEHQLDQWLVAETFACRRGKGQHKALSHARTLLRQSRWFLKMDVRAFFPSLRHEVVLATLAETVADPKLFALMERIVRHPSHAGQGLPIGNLTSQWFANLVLGRLDRHVLQIGVGGYVRYMDDFVLFGDSKHLLEERRAEVVQWLAAHHLQPKESATILAPVRQGLPFLGFNLHRGITRLRPENLRRTRHKLRQRQRQWECGAIDDRRLADCTRSVLAHLNHGNTMALRRSWFAGTRAADRFLRQPQQPRRQLQQHRLECAVGQPQPQCTVDPQQQPGSAPRQDVPWPDPGGRAHAHPRAAHS